MTSTITALPIFGGEYSTFDPNDNAAIEVTTSGSFDPTYSRCSMSVGNHSGWKSPKWSDASTFWFHWVGKWGGNTNFWGAQPYMSGWTNGGTNVVWVEDTNVSTYGELRLYTLQSGVKTQVGDAITMPGGVLHTVDVKVVAGGSGSAAAYVAGSEVISATGLNHGGFAGVGQLRGGFNPGVGTPAYFSQIIGKATSTVGNFVITDNLDTESSAPNNAWTGGVDDINEIVLNDALFIFTNTPDDVSTFFDSTLDLTGYNILGRGVAARVRVQDAGPTGCQLVLESGGTNYFSTTKTAAVGFEALFNSWMTNPAGGAWDPTTAAATKGGVKAIA